MAQSPTGFGYFGLEPFIAIVLSDIIIAAGFAIFALLSFSPTQRFGLVVSAGTVIDILASRFALAVLAGDEVGKPMALVK